MNHPQTLDPHAQAYLAQWMLQHQVNTLLEIGSGYAQSSIAWAQQVTNLNIVTLEKDLNRARVAKEAIAQAKLEARIKLVQMDANLYQADQSFDVIFLDGPKAQLLTHFNRFISFLNPSGSVWIDNIDFHGLRNASIQGRPNLSAMMRKLIHFMNVIESHPDYLSQQILIGDGLMRVWRKYPDLKL